MPSNMGDFDHHLTGYVTGHTLRLEPEELEKRKERNDRQAALIFAILIAAFAALGIVLLVTSSPRVGPREISDCSSVEPASGRLACFDELSRHSKSVPFKGAPPAELDGKK
jgi:hypothetical protein